MASYTSASTPAGATAAAVRTSAVFVEPARREPDTSSTRIALTKPAR